MYIQTITNIQIKKENTGCCIASRLTTANVSQLYAFSQLNRSKKTIAKLKKTCSYPHIPLV